VIRNPHKPEFKAKIMKAAVVPAVNSAWEIKEIETPEPGPGQVLIKIRASGMCYTDVHQTRGELPGKFPRTLGHEPVGEIESVGVGVRTRKVGDRVGVPWVQMTCGRCEWCARGKPTFCEKSVGTGVDIGGGHAEYMLAFADATMLLPDGLSYEDAAPLFCAGYTVWSGLRWSEPKPGERIAVVGIGGLGHLAVQYARAAGFHTIALSRSPDKDASIHELGADEIVRDGKGLMAAGGADVILGTSNSIDAMADSIQGLRPDGRFVLMGFEPKPLPVSPGDLIGKGFAFLAVNRTAANTCTKPCRSLRPAKLESSPKRFRSKRSRAPTNASSMARFVTAQ
jgi:alcohol dehydrogenase